MRKTVVFALFLALFLQIFCFGGMFAEENKYYLGSAVDAGLDTGYSERNPINEDNPHFGWTLGEFFLNGYSSVNRINPDEPIILKNVGDKVALWFCLNQNLDALNGDEDMTVCEDVDGYDNYFGIEKTNFGRGALIVRHKDSENHWGTPVIYTDYLAANTSVGAYTQVELFEEGDYEVALNYEVEVHGYGIFGWDPFPDYYNYRIFFRFSVRNGNCMVYPFDIGTGAELTNSSFTENGFYLDFANSKYLETVIKKEVLNDTADGLVEDVRFNRPAKDKEQYAEEGIYTITVRNAYTNQETVKKIYVGTNDVLKAHATTGFTVEEINRQIALGATVSETGELIPAKNLSQTGTDADATDSQEPTQSKLPVTAKWAVIFCVVVLVGLFVAVMLILTKAQKREK